MSDLFLSLNGQRVTSGSISIPYYGTWVADLVLPVTLAVATSCALTVGNLTLQGAPYRTAPFAGARSVRFVGGYGGWRNTLGSQEYAVPSGVMLSTVLGDAAGAVGERVHVASDRSLGAYWLREEGPAQRTLRLLAGPEWYVDPSGVTQVGPRTGAAITSAVLVNTWDGGRGLFEVSTEDYASWMPGATFANELVTVAQTVSLVRIETDNDGKLRLHILSAGAVDA